LDADHPENGVLIPRRNTSNIHNCRIIRAGCLKLIFVFVTELLMSATRCCSMAVSKSDGWLTALGTANIWYAHEFSMRASA
jgi:hypothetical protein